MIASENHPTETDALEIARRFSGTQPVNARRFSTGTGHWVYEVSTSVSTRIVVRLGAANQRDELLGALHWSRTLRPLGVPLPELLGNGEYRSYPYLILERLDGDDLGQVYHSLTSGERRSIAEAVCRVQGIVGALPDGAGYGFLRFPNEPGHLSWNEVVEASLARSRRRIKAAGLLSPSIVDRVAARIEPLRGYFSRVRPTPFLDDVTTKNVLVHAGQLSGIVDVDWLCFGDSLFTIGLTRTALLSSGADPDYADHWCDVLQLNGEQRRAVLFYTALFCVDFMGEFGQRFTQGVVPHDPERVARLETILDEHVDAVA